MPLPPPVIVIHAAGVDALHAQPGGAVTWMVPVPPPAANDCALGARATLHDMPAWSTVNVCPAIAIRPVRPLGLGLAATSYVTVPVPLPLVPAVIVSQGSVVTELQAQVELTSTRRPVAPPAGTELPVGDKELVHVPEVVNVASSEYPETCPPPSPQMAWTRNR